MSSRPAWSTELVPGQAPKPQRNPVSKNQKKKIIIIIIIKECSANCSYENVWKYDTFPVSPTYTGTPKERFK